MQATTLIKIGNRILLFAFILFTTTMAAAQTGVIKGTVTDAKTGESIIGANVYIEGTSTGSTTDFDGNFQIKNLRPGSYDIIVSFVSYQPQKIERVNVVEGKDANLNVKLLEDVSQLAEINIVAAKITHTENAVLMMMKDANQIVNGISSQQISKTQDSDAAQVVKRVPGVTVVNNRFIMIRGLSERYNTALLNNAYAPSMEADIRSFSFDIIPSSMIDRMMIYKTPSAELPGDFAGGVVKIYTKGIPDNNSFSFSIGNAYRSGTTFKPFLEQVHGKNYWLGINDRSYNLPSDFPSDLRLLNNNEENKLVDAARSLPNNWQLNEKTAAPDRSLSFSGAVKFNIGKVEVGNITSVNYSNSLAANSIIRRDFNEYDLLTKTSQAIYDFTDNEYQHNIRSGILHNWAVRLNNNHTIEFKNLYNQISRGQYIYRSGHHYESNYYAGNHSYHQIYRGIYSGQLTGTHKLFNGNSNVDWMAGYGSSYRDEPDYKRYRSDIDTITSNATLYIPFGAAQSFFLGRFYSEMNENLYTGAFNFTQKIIFKNRPDFTPSFSAGMFYENKKRNFSARNIGYTRASLFLFDQNLLNVSIDSLFHRDNINDTKGIIIDEQSNPSDSYTASNEITAWYGMIFIPVTHKIKVNTGVRFENNKRNLSSATLTNEPVEVFNHHLSILPSVNASYNITDKMLLKFAYGITVNRPEFRELAPFGFYDFSYNLVKKGNEHINDATIHNYDMRWELYPAANEIISVAAFYKHFINPIETFFLPGGGSGGIKSFYYSNALSAKSLGLELEVRKSLSGLSSFKFIDDLGILVNAAFINSIVELGDVAGQSNLRPMQGQSPYILNTGLFYNNIESKLQVNLMYNIIGKRIFIIGFDDYPDIYEMPRHQLDLTFIKGFGKYFEIRGGIRDIANSGILLMQDANKDGIFDRVTDQVLQNYKPGTSISLGVGVKL